MVFSGSSCVIPGVERRMDRMRVWIKVMGSWYRVVEESCTKDQCPVESEEPTWTT
jgi:hypothetical protein